MAKAKKNKEREERIKMEIIVDAYGPEEKAISWYYYLDEAHVGPKNFLEHFSQYGYTSDIH